MSSPNFLKRHYLDDAKLAQRALLEFHRALQSGRLIAFTGAMTTEPRGYGSWKDLREAYARLAKVAARRGVSPRALWVQLEQELGAIAKGNPAAKSSSPSDRKIDGINAYANDEERSKTFDVRVALGLFEEVVIGTEATLAGSSYAGDWELDRVREPLDLLSIAIAHYFRRPRHARVLKVGADPLHSLLTSIGAQRIATLNYDFELEGQLMLSDTAADRDDPPFERLRKLRNRAHDGVEWNIEHGRIRRVLPSGIAIESDILDRERIDRVLEFAMGADDVDYHILHLHGRACDPKSMILSYRDYDRLYRRNDLMKLPFEFAQRIMMGGNPILFVGLGMSEAELNKTLQDFVSGSPYRRVAPTFLLWNATPKDCEKIDGTSTVEMRRLDWLHRLGVFAIFDTDLPGDLTGEDGFAKLTRLINQLPAHAAAIGAREAYVGGTRWRHMGVKVTQTDAPVILWELTDRSRKVAAPWPADGAKVCAALTARTTSANATPMICVIGAQGCGKGSLAFDLAKQSAVGGTPANTLLINGSFSFDTDSILDGIARFLGARSGNAYTDAVDDRPRMSRSVFFRNLGKGPMPQVLVIINGLERFFGITGELLSAELDELLRIVARGDVPKLRLLVFGTERVRRYMKEQPNISVIDGEDIGLARVPDAEHLPVQRFAAIQHAFAVPVEELAPAEHRRLIAAQAAWRAASSSRISGDREQLRGAFFDVYVSAKVLEAQLGGGEVELAKEVLRALAFIGLPAEVNVLAHVPRILATLRGDRAIGSDTPATFRDRLRRIMAQLTDIGLVLELSGYRCAPGAEGPGMRYTLPRFLLSELRSRFSIPLSEAKLSTAFNMSLYVAQPADGYIPEPEIHDELGSMIDRLLGAYRDIAELEPTELPDDLSAVLRASVTDLMPHKHRRPADDERSPDTLAQQLFAVAGPANVQCLRAALALMRGYYTTTDLLTLDVGDRLIREDRDGILLEHVERLDTLIDAFGKVAMARDTLRAALEPRGVPFDRFFGESEPFYPDEVVWLHNERGVVRLAMGDLPEARASFLRAFDINRRHVECDDRSHNWRRIRLNQLTIDLESGEIGLAMRKIEEILDVSCQRYVRVASDDATLPEREVPAAWPREDRLATAIALGYRAWASNLRGEAGTADEDFSKAIALLEEAGETRAQAYFRRLRAEQVRAGDELPRLREIETALDLALATRQMDLVYRLRVMRASAVLSSPPGTVPESDRERAPRALNDAMRYALQTDVHRVRVEAGMAMAERVAAAGDFEGALRDASDAMMVATRFGLELKKILMRSVMARILGDRGHPTTATHLAASAIRIGSRRRYQDAITHAETTLASIPRISKITDIIDVAARRQL